MSCGAETEAKSIYTAMLEGEDVTFPPLDLNNESFNIPQELLDGLKEKVTPLKIEDLTTGQVEGSGAFDVIMRGFRAHLDKEYQSNRITGAEYTKAYTALIGQAIGGAVQFLLSRDQTYWAAVTAQLGAFTARAQAETAKMQLAQSRFQALTSKSEYALTKLRLASESMNFCTLKYNYDFMLPQQYKMLQAQTDAQSAQTVSTLANGQPVRGVLGKQIDLYNQQITSYQRDAEVKAARFWIDSWTTMKAIDEGLEPPTVLANTNLNTVLQRIQQNNGLT